MLTRILLCKKLGSFDDPLLYRVRDDFPQLSVGQWVEVPFRSRTARGIVVEYPSQLSADLKEGDIRSMEKVLREEPLTSTQIELAQFMASYYQTSLTRALKLMVPKQIWEGKFKSVNGENPALALASQFRARLSRPVRLRRTIVPLCDSDVTSETMLAKPLECPQFGLPKAPHALSPFTHQLTLPQEEALRKIQESQKPVLLHGVTGSGKTELYLRLISESLKAGKQSILLVPEIALTPQMIKYFRGYFGGSIAVFHSRLSDKKRAVEWRRVKRGEAALVIGSRSAIFAPVNSLGTLILDEEHEWTYKQESSPYYEAHTVALKLAELYGATLILGSATPRLESYAKAKEGEYTLVTLEERIHQAVFPKITVVDLREEFKKKNFSIFSELLKKKMEETLERKEQILLFVNQRGLARAVVCRDCGHTERCPRCDISLKFHRKQETVHLPYVIPNAVRNLTPKLIRMSSPEMGHQVTGEIPHCVRNDLGGEGFPVSFLLCHYCGFKKDPPSICPTCSSPYIKYMGVGTQKVEEEVRKLFPDARLIRADRDTTKGKDGFSPIYHAFLNREYDVLIGTQMVAKGLDFSGVSLVGLVLADIGLHLPDFRSSERLFQLITQVAGRCGRSEKNPGEVILQTYQPGHPAIREAARYGYRPFADKELEAREKAGYPPYGRLIKFTVVGTDLERLKTHIQEATETLEDITRTHELGVKVTGAPALIPKLSNRYYYQVLLRGEKPEQLFDFWKIPKGWRVDIDPIHTA